MSQTLSIESGDQSVALLDDTIGERLRQICDQFPQREAVVSCSQNLRVSYETLWRDVANTASVLLALGIEVGDRVGIWSSNRYEWLVVQYACIRAGAILVNINPAYQKGELAFALRQAGVKLLFYASRFKQTETGPILDAGLLLDGGLPDLQRCVNFDAEWPAFLEQSRSEPEELRQREALLHPDDPINIQYTSGTTGFSKGVALSHRNLLNNAFHTALGLSYSPIDRVCVPVPFYHCFGMVLGSLACLTAGACVVIPSETFQPLPVLEAVEAERCTSLYGVPTMFRAILEHPETARFDVASLRTGIMAGSPCPIELMKEVVHRLHMPEVAIGYGMTETSPLSTLSRRDDSLERRVGTVGKPIPHIEVSVRDLENNLVPRGQPGEFCARGYHVMRGYWNDPAATRQAIDAQGWMHSGDLAAMDEDGYVRIVGRLKDLIIRGGENIAPREVESVLELHPVVSEAQVIGVPSHRYGDEVMAWIKFRPGQSATENQLVMFCNEHMAPFKRPRFWRFVDSFPMTTTGKIQKYRLREMAIEALNLEDVAAEKTA